MKYKKNYTKFFGYTMDADEYIPSELSGSRAQDLHHITPKRMGGSKTCIYDGVTYDIDSAVNIIALTREEHNIAHDPSHHDHLTIDELYRIHKKKMDAFENVSKNSKLH
jgi:hypothetical protein